MKKNHSCYWRRYLKHIALTLLFYPLSALGAQGHISIKGQSITIMQAIQLIEKNSDYTFFYNAADLENKQRKDINCNGSIDEILNEVFSDGKNTWVAKRQPMGRLKSREWHRHCAASKALDMVRRYLAGLPVDEA